MRLSLRAGAAGAALAALMAGRAQAIDSNIRSYVCAKLDDFTATVNTIQANQREINKISKDAYLLYKLSNVTMRYKEPNKIRIEGSLEGSRGTFILNGPIQYVAFPKVGIKTRRDFGDSPGKRKSLIDVGLVSEYYLSYTDADFVRESSVDGVPCAVFDMRYKNKKDTSHHVIYVDPKTRVVRKRESYSQAGKLQAIYFYKDVREVAPGIWFPTLIEAQNIDRVIAATSSYKDIKVNTGIPDSMFQL